MNLPLSNVISPTGFLPLLGSSTEMLEMTHQFPTIKLVGSICFCLSLNLLQKKSSHFRVFLAGPNTRYANSESKSTDTWLNWLTTEVDFWFFWTVFLRTRRGFFVEDCLQFLQHSVEKFKLKIKFQKLKWLIVPLYRQWNAELSSDLILIAW